MTRWSTSDLHYILSQPGSCGTRDALHYWLHHVVPTGQNRWKWVLFYCNGSGFHQLHYHLCMLSTRGVCIWCLFMSNCWCWFWCTHSIFLFICDALLKKPWGVSGLTDHVAIYLHMITFCTMEKQIHVYLIAKYKSTSIIWVRRKLWREINEVVRIFGLWHWNSYHYHVWCLAGEGKTLDVAAE